MHAYHSCIEQVHLGHSEAEWQREAVVTPPVLNLRNLARLLFQQFYKGENAVPKFSDIGK